MVEEESAETTPKPLVHPHNKSNLAHITGRDPFSSSHDSLIDARIIELETENLRLQRLVAELLIKNQQLRKA